MVNAGSGAKPGSQSSQAAAEPGANSADDARDVLVALLDAAGLQARQTELGQSDPRVSVAFALGWQMAAVYRPDYRSAVAPALDDDLPGISRLASDELQQMGLDQLQAGIAKLRAAITGAGLSV